jgi:type II secretory pathway component GspD/PulD (secretin)
VPILGDIPLVGDLLFKHNRSRAIGRSLLVFLSPTIVYSSRDTDFLRKEWERRNMKLKDEMKQLLSSDRPLVSDAR